MRNTGMCEEQAGIKIARRNISLTSDIQMTPPGKSYKNDFKSVILNMFKELKETC